MLLPAVKAKMWLCGYQPGPKPNAQADGFQGFGQRGQRFYFSRNRVTTGHCPTNATVAVG